MESAKVLISLLVRNNNYLPQIAYPEVVFLFLSQQNFFRTWRWLSLALFEDGHDVQDLHPKVGSDGSIDTKKLGDFYSTLCHHITHTADKSTVSSWERAAELGNTAAIILCDQRHQHDLLMKQHRYMEKNAITSNVS